MRWFILAPISVLFTLLAILLAPVLALFVREGRLPDWLAWFDTPDNFTTGDAAFQTTQMAWTKSQYIYALFWLWRNPGYGFDHAIGARINGGFIYQFSGDDDTSNTPLHEGWVWRTVTNLDTSYYWQFLAIYKWSDSFCIKINLGWKLWTFNKQDLINAQFTGQKAQGLEAGQVRQLVCTINPFTKYN